MIVGQILSQALYQTFPVPVVAALNDVRLSLRGIVFVCVSVTVRLRVCLSVD